MAEIARRHPEVMKARLVVSGERADDRMTLEVEVEGAAPEGLAERIAETIRDVTKLRGEVDAARARQPAERRQGDRGHAQVRLSGDGRARGRAAPPAARVGQLSTLTLPSFTTLRPLGDLGADELANFSARAAAVLGAVGVELFLHVGHRQHGVDVAR